MILSRLWTLAAIASTAFGLPSPDLTSAENHYPESSSPETEDRIDISGLEDFIRNDPGTSAMLLVSLGAATMLAGQSVWRGFQEGFRRRRASRSTPRQCDVVADHVEKNAHPDDTLIVRPEELALPLHQADAALPPRLDLTHQQEALRQGYFQGLKSGGRTGDRVEVWQALDGFEEGYRAKAYNRGGMDIARRVKFAMEMFSGDREVREAWHRGWVAGYERAEHAKERATELKENIELAHGEGVAVGVCVAEAREHQLECATAEAPHETPQTSFSPRDYERWIRQCMAMVRERNLAALLRTLKYVPLSGPSPTRIFFPLQNQVNSVKKQATDSFNAMAKVKVEPAKFAPAAGAFISNAAKNFRPGSIPKAVYRGA
ncbi:MAG: hypothetical protein M1823_003622 [Watsoniomyces obsoletus]|nr:MAG: hypothetical protein M1823_003622 [Watsoniomyces obsoletus]